MRLNASTDYALRVLLYLAASGEDWTPAAEIADAYGLSAHHIAKIAKDLTGRGWLEARRGSGGGLRLRPSARRLALGRMVTALEPMELAECFRPEKDDCRLTGRCRLQGALREAGKAFVAALDGYTLDDLAKDRQLPRLLGIA